MQFKHLGLAAVRDSSPLRWVGGSAVCCIPGVLREHCFCGCGHRPVVFIIFAQYVCGTAAQGKGAWPGPASHTGLGYLEVGEGGNIKLPLLPYSQISEHLGNPAGQMSLLHGLHLAHALEAERPWDQLANPFPTSPGRDHAQLDKKRPGIGLGKIRFKSYKVIGVSQEQISFLT